MYKPHTYSLFLTNAELEMIRFVASRGYCEAVYEAVTHESTTTDEQSDSAEYHIPEWAAWEICDEEANNGGHAFGPVSDALTQRLYAFVDGVV